MAEILSKAVRVGLLEQVNWATPRGASSAFKAQPYLKNVSIANPGVVVDNYDMLNSTGMHREEERTRIDSVTQLKRLPFEGYATKASIADHVYAAIQAVSEGASTPYTKTFTPTTSTLEFPNDDGMVFTVAMDSITGSDGVILQNAILDSLSLSFDNLAAGKARLMMMKGEWMGNAILTSQNLSGSWVALENSPFFYNASSTTNDFTQAGANTITIDTINLAGCLRKFELMINNNLSVRCATVGGKANNYTLDQKFTVNIDLAYNATTFATLTKYVAGYPIVITDLGNGIAGTVDGGILFNGTAFLTSPPEVYDGEYRAIRLQAELVKPTTGWLPIITLSDSIDKGW